MNKKSIITALLALVSMAKDTYTLTISRPTSDRLQSKNGTTIRVGRQKKGLRSIAVGKQKPITCSLITTETLPDYPTKDMRTGFADNGYRDGDSVTIIGWLKDMPQEEFHTSLPRHQYLGSMVRRTPHGNYECCRAWRDLLLPVRL